MARPPATHAPHEALPVHARYGPSGALHALPQPAPPEGPTGKPPSAVAQRRGRGEGRGSGSQSLGQRPLDRFRLTAAERPGPTTRGHKPSPCVHLPFLDGTWGPAH